MRPAVEENAVLGRLYRDVVRVPAQRDVLLCVVAGRRCLESAGSVLAAVGDLEGVHQRIRRLVAYHRAAVVEDGGIETGVAALVRPARVIPGGALGDRVSVGHREGVHKLLRRHDVGAAAEAQRVEIRLESGVLPDVAGVDDLRGVGVRPKEARPGVQAAVLARELEVHDLLGGPCSTLPAGLVTRGVERRAGPGQQDPGLQRLHGDSVQRSVADGSGNVESLALQVLVAVCGRQVLECRVAVREDLLHALLVRRAHQRGAVVFRDIHRLLGDDDSQHAAVRALAAPELEQVEAVPGPEAESVALQALLQHGVGARIHQVAGLAADVVLEEEVDVIDGLVVARPHARERVAAHMGVAYGELAHGGGLVAVQHVVRAGVHAYELIAVVGGRPEVVGLVYEAADDGRIIGVVVLVVGAVRERFKEAAAAGCKQRRKCYENVSFHICSHLKVKFYSCRNGCEQGVGGYSRTGILRIHIRDSGEGVEV